MAAEKFSPFRAVLDSNRPGNNTPEALSKLAAQLVQPDGSVALRVNTLLDHLAGAYPAHVRTLRESIDARRGIVKLGISTRNSSSPK